MLIPRLKPRAPLYSTLSNVQIVLDATGLRSGTDNSYGTVSGTTLQVWKSISPGNTGLSFGADPIGVGGSLLKIQDGYVEFAGRVCLSATGSVNDFETMSYASPATNLKYTIHCVLKIGQNASPNLAYGLWGTNAASGANKGTFLGFDDRILASNSDGLSGSLTAGGTNIIVGSPDDLITPNVPFVLTEETDLSQAAGDRRKWYINGTLFAFSVTSASTAVASVPSFVLEIGGYGNNAGGMKGWISHWIWHNSIESSGTRNAFVASLLPFKNKVTNYFNHVDETVTYSLYNTLATAGRYYFVQGLLQDPVNYLNLIQIYHNGNSHTEDNDKRVSKRTSTDMGRTWSAESTLYDLDGAGTYAVQDGEWGWTSDINRIHGITDWHTTIAINGSAHQLWYSYSDDGGANWTHTDISSVVPSDGLAAYRAHGNIVEGGDGYIYGLLYKTTDEADGTNQAIYLLRKPVGTSTTWTALTLKAPGTTAINESSIQPLDNNTLLVVSRDETTKEWNQWTVTNNGTTVVNNGALALGETLTSAGPPLLTKFDINGSRVIAFWMLDKTNAIIKVCYGTAANLITNNVTGWDTDTKLTVIDQTQILHYGRVLHYHNTLNAIGSFALEPNPPTLTENSLVTMHLPAQHYSTLRTELGI